jgi:hypothetical protein
MSKKIIPQIFEYNSKKIRTIHIDGVDWFYAADVCDALDLKQVRTALSRLDDDERRTVASSNGSVSASRTNPAIISESGVYNLIFQSRKPEAKQFKKWVTSEILPILRRTGKYSIRNEETPVFVRRFNDNWNRVSPGYFSVLGELFIRLYGRLEHLGYKMPDVGDTGLEMRPDISVGRKFVDYLTAEHPKLLVKRSCYNHKLPDGKEVLASQYPVDMLPVFIDYVDRVWLHERAAKYLKERDPKALEYLPKLLTNQRR